MADTVKCPNCGKDNDISFALCQQCLTPLTAYAGQLSGEAYEGKLAAQVKALNARPVIVAIMAAFNVLFALFFPLATFIASLPGKATTDPDEAYRAGLTSAFGAVGAALTGFVMIPLAVALCYLAWATYTQKSWSWGVNAAVVGVFAAKQALLFRAADTTHHVIAAISILLSLCLLFIWYRPGTKAWFGQ